MIIEFEKKGSFSTLVKGSVMKMGNLLIDEVLNVIYKDIDHRLWLEVFLTQNTMDLYFLFFITVCRGGMSMHFILNLRVNQLKINALSG